MKFLQSFLRRHFEGKTSGRVGKFRLFSQAKIYLVDNAIQLLKNRGLTKNFPIMFLGKKSV